MWVLIALVTALAVDFLQYVYQTIAWWIFSSNKEGSLQAEDPEAWREKEFLAPDRINTAADLFWILKILLVAAGYIALIFQLAQQVT